MVEQQGQGSPCVVVIGGPNGAGKTTISRAALSESFGLTDFVNVDAIASRLSAFDPDRSAMEAGRVLYVWLQTQSSQRDGFTKGYWQEGTPFRSTSSNAGTLARA